MTMPAWWALPPEIPSALLSAGPGAGPMIAAAAAWNALATGYTAAADELLAALTSSSGIWEGQSAEQYRAAHQPFLAWLAESSASAASAAAQHETIASAYSAALAAMPTMPELISNHVVHAALTATNFLGINTIPIAVNEADYARMWAQAATVMTTYQSIAETALAAMPQSLPAPPIVSEGDSTGGRVAARSMQASAMAKGSEAGKEMDDSDRNNNNDDPIRKILSQFPFLLQTIDALRDFVANPSPATLIPLLSTVGSLATYLITTAPIYLAYATPLLVPALIAGAAVGISVPSGALLLQQETGPPEDQQQSDKNDPDRGQRGQRVRHEHQALSVGTPPAAMSPPPQAPPTGSAPAPTAPPPPSPASAPAQGFGYAIEDQEPPGTQFGPTSRTGTTTPASSSASSAAAAAAVQSSESAAKRKQAAQARRRNRKVVVLEEGERMTANADAVPEFDDAPSAGGQGSNLVGSAGAITQRDIKASGFAKLPEGAFATGPTTPMLPQTWSGEPPPAGQGENHP